MMRPLIVGENNPYGSDPYYALYPDPPMAAGGRLCRILGLSPEAYLARFDRTNLVAGWQWRAAEARRAAAEILEQRVCDAADGPLRVLILLGAKVRRAFGYKDARLYHDHGGVVCLPHPSGRCRLWDRPGAVQFARAAVEAACPGVLS